MDKAFIVILCFALIIGIFALSNSDSVVIDFIFTNVEISQALVILVSVLMGALVVFIVGGIKKLKVLQEIKELKRKIKTLEEENNSLKDLVDKREDLQLIDEDYHKETIGYEVEKEDKMDD